MGEHTDFQSVALPVELPGPKGPDVARLGRTTQTKTVFVERWRPAPGYESTYQVSDHGRVRRVAGGRGASAGRILSSRLSTHGYLSVSLSGGARGAQRRIDVHVLVARAFIGQAPVGTEVDHVNRDRSDARLVNLRYLSRLENNQNKGPHHCGGCGATDHRRPDCSIPSGRAASRRYYYLAYLSCGLTPAEARSLQQANLRRAWVLIRSRKAVCS